MSFVLAAPDALVSAASDLAGLGSTISTANAVAAPPTTGVLAAAADEVSTQIAALFSHHAVEYQQLSSQVSQFHQRFVQALTEAANAYASAETRAAQTLVNAVNTPAEMVLGHPLIGTGSGWMTVGGAAGLLGTGAGLFGGDGAAAAQAAAALLAPAAITGAASVPAANILAPLGTAIENAYLAVEPWVAYGFDLVSYGVRWLFLIGILAPQINYFYYLFEPMVRGVLFNTIDFLDGTVSFGQGLNNIYAATTASINQFVTTETNWFHSLFPPLPPIGTNLP
ncbi:PE family protein [Mycobacterium sp. THU-M104]|uniref:PE family protein n=1 Tax=Mycobacterium sp. THU-M104 TaxID=3410515 RepID=UPI003B99246F